MASTHGRNYDVVIFGATGFTGALTAEYLAKVTPAAGVRWAIAGRSEEKLREAARKLGDPAGMGVIVADTGDAAALRAMTGQCAAVATTVGPYTKYGSELVAACVDTGTHYCDLTGEFPFVRDMIDKHHEAAKAKGVKIVHCCGFDCVPVDVGTMLVTEGLPVPAASVRILCTKMNGGASGGTLDSAAEIEHWGKDAANKEKVRDPYVLAPDTPAHLRVDSKWTTKHKFGREPDFGTYSIPYFMAVTDNRLVRRSLVHRGQATSFDEAMSIGAIARLSGFVLTHLPSFASNPRPKAGEGPTDSVRRDGSFEFELVARGAKDEECRLAVTGQGDPGYLGTSVILAECALCLALDADPSLGRPEDAGVLTPSTAMGKALVARLEQTGRFQFRQTLLRAGGGAAQSKL